MLILVKMVELHRGWLSSSQLFLYSFLGSLVWILLLLDSGSSHSEMTISGPRGISLGSCGAEAFDLLNDYHHHKGK